MGKGSIGKVIGGKNVFKDTRDAKHKMGQAMLDHKAANMTQAERDAQNPQNTARRKARLAREAAAKAAKLKNPTK